MDNVGGSCSCCNCPVIGVVAISGKNGGTTATEINMKKMFDTIYADLKDQLPDSLTTQEIDVKDGEQVAEYTGLVSTKNVEKLLVSEPMISSQAYSAVALKVKQEQILKVLNKKC